MRRRFPGMSSLANMSIANKLGIVVLLLCIPIAALVFVQYQDQQSERDQAASESDGLDFVSAVIPFLREVQLHRGLVDRVLGGDPASVAALEQSRAAADQALVELNAMDRKHGKGFGTTTLVEAINSQWEAAKGLEADAAASSAAHTQLIQAGVFPLLSAIALESELVLDPSLDTRSAVDALTGSLPRMTEALSLLRAQGASILLERGGASATDAERQALIAQLTTATLHAEALNRQLQTAMDENGDFSSTLIPVLARSNAIRDTFLDSARAKLINTATLPPDSTEDFFFLGGDSIDMSNDLLVTARDTLDAEFESRADAASQSFAIYGGAAFGGILLALALALFIVASITRPLNHLAEVADRISLGELDAEIDIDSGNEIGRLAESLRRMQTSLRSAIERLRQRRTAA